MRRVFLILCCLAAAIDAKASDFATQVVSSHGPFGPAPYDDPTAVLGKPSTLIKDPIYSTPFRCSLVYPACEKDPNGKKLVVTLGAGAEIVVKFDHRVSHDPGNPYGIDFIVFGNSLFESGGYLSPNTNMETYHLTSPTWVYSEPVIVSVSQDGNNWYTYSNGPYGDDAFPTNAYAWDRVNHCWGKEQDWTKPVDPNLSLDRFNGLSVADAIDIYNGSAGGTGFDLAESGLPWIQYIKVQSSEAGEIDGFADVASCGDYQHPYPPGDINKDCKVDEKDLSLFCTMWLQRTGSPQADFDGDGIVNLRDWAVLGNNWRKCNWQCQ